jgi:hypothetical protein
MLHYHASQVSNNLNFGLAVHECGMSDSILVLHVGPSSAGAPAKPMVSHEC